MKEFARGLQTVVLLLFAGVFSALSQTEVLVVPGQYSNLAANSSDNSLLDSQNQIVQQVYAGSMLSASGLPNGDQITAIGFRIISGESGLPAQTVSNYSVWLGQAVFSPGNLSTTLADNGSNMMLVRSGSLTITDGQFAGGAGINPFGMIQFSQPYDYVGGDLLIEIAYSDFLDGEDVEAAYPYNNDMAQTAFGSGLNTTTANQGIYSEALVMAFNVVPFNTVATPEPTVPTLLACGILGLFWISRIRRR